jgi:alpha-tubulin suppressor-like RCC1 family protein
METKLAVATFGSASLALLLSTTTLQPSATFAGPVVTAAAAGYSHTLFTKSDGSLWGMGDNSVGQLGLGLTTTSTNLPVEIFSLGVVRLIATGESHSLFQVGAALWAMGENDYGQLGDGTTTNHYVPEIVFTGNAFGSVPLIAGGQIHSLFAAFNGATPGDAELWGMGANYEGALGDATYTERHTPEQISSSTPIMAVAAGEQFSLYVRTDGSLWGMGYNRYGQLGLGIVLDDTNAPAEIVTTGVTAVACGSEHGLFLKSDGSLWGMGDNEFGQLGVAPDVETDVPVEIVASGVKAIACGSYHSLYLKSDGSLWGMGRNGEGQLGDGTSTNHPVAIPIAASKVVAVAAGEYHSLFITSDGSLWGMGYNEYGQLGDGTYAVTRLTPVRIVPSRPRITGIRLSGTSLILTGANGESGEAISVLSSTSLTQPFSQWKAVANSILNANGDFTITVFNGVDPAAPRQFFILQAQ